MVRQDQHTIRDYVAAMGETYSILRWCWDEFVNDISRKAVRKLLCFSTCGRLVSLLYPWLMGLGIDALINHDAKMAVMAVVGTAFNYVIGAFIERFSGHAIELVLGENLRTIDRRSNEMFFEKELGLHLEEGTELTQANMEKGYNRLHTVQGSFLWTGIDSALTLIITWLMLSFLSPTSGGIIFVFLGVNTLVSLGFNRFIMVNMEPVDAMFRAINLHRNGRQEGVERVITSGRRNSEIEEMDEAFRKVILEDRRIWFTYVNSTVLRSVLSGFAVTLTGLYAGYQVWIGAMSIAELVPILTWAGMASSQIRLLARVEREVNWCIPSLRSLKEALTMECKVLDAPDAVELPDEPLTIEINNLGHTYSDKDAKGVLRHVFFSIAPGEIVALIGRTGCGKSTLTRLLQRYMDPMQGSILVGGHDLRSVIQESWRSLVAFIPQRSQVFDGTLRDNLLYGLTGDERLSVTDEKILQLMAVLCIDFGSRLTNGLDTRVGRRGMKLSGGEAQRVMILAAVLRKPRFMIIDEATSSLDAVTQAAVQAGIYKILRESGASALIIAHRLATVMHCDKYVVMKPVDSLINGDPQVESIAHSPAELHQVSPIFRRLADLEGVRIAGIQ